MNNSERKKLPDIVGIIPASDRTPDIYYCGDPSSEKVAAIALLTIWFLPAKIQRILKQRASSIICGLSPLSGGRRLESAFNTDAHVLNLGAQIENFDFGSLSFTYSGSCVYPKWDEENLLQQGRIAVYAISSSEDERNGYTFRFNQSTRLPKSEWLLPDEDCEFKPLAYPKESELSLQMIFSAFALPDSERDRRLSEVLQREFSYISSFYDMVPKRTAHEIAHILEFGSGLFVTPQIAQEVQDKISTRNHFISHYANPREAIAELAGIALLKYVVLNAGINFGLPTTMLDKILPDSFDYVERQVSKIVDCPQGLNNVP